MQDEVNEKTVSLCIRCGKVTASLLKAAMKKALAKMEQEKQKLQGQKQPKQDKEDKTYRGKQSMDKLMKQNVQLSNIEITDGNIKSFERVAKKYSIGHALAQLEKAALGTVGGGLVVPLRAADRTEQHAVRVAAGR